MNAKGSGVIAHLVGLALVTASLSAQSLSVPEGTAEDRAATQEVAKRLDLTDAAGLHRADASRLVGGGKDYQVFFSREGAKYHPALGVAAAKLQHVELTPIAVARGAETIAVGSEVMPTHRGLQVQYRRAPLMIERYDVHPHGVELSWRFDARPAGDGDLVVRYAVDTTFVASQPAADGGVELILRGVGGVSIGGVTGIDANGDRVSGTLRYQKGELELSLPAAFVDSAAYPLVLDPLLGTVFGVQQSTNTDGDPDVAYDETTERYLVVYKRTFSATNVWPRAQQITKSGVSANGTIFYGSQGRCDRVRVANLAALNRFGIVWCSDEFGYGSVNFQAFNPATSSLSHPSVLASTTAVSPYKHADIGAVGRGPAHTDRGFVVTFEDDIQNAIRARRVYFSASDQLVAPSAYNVFTDQGGIGSTYSEPEISRSSDEAGRFLVAVRRFSGVGPSVRVSVRVVGAATSAVGPSASFGSLIGGSLTAPDVDGVGTHWVVAWQQSASGTSAQVVVRGTVDLDPNSGTSGVLTLGPTASFGGGIQSASSPSLGYAAGRTWLGYRWDTSFSSTLRASALNSASATSCGDSFVQSIPSSATASRIVVGTMASGGDLTGEMSLLVFEDGNSIYGQLLLHYGSSGSLVSLGGGCGVGGTQAFNHSPGVGSSHMACNLNGLSPSALLSVFNLAPVVNSISCGACSVVPYSVTSVQTVVQGEANIAFPIPCLPALVGSTVFTQWTTLDLTQSPCTLAPNFALSERVLWTFGQ